MNDAETFYTRSGPAEFVPTPVSISPWNPNHQSGVAISALLVHLIEQVPTLAPMMLARLTLDIARPTPMARITATCTVTREGAKMQNLEARLMADGQITARATALRVRLAESPAAAEALDHPAPEDSPDRPFMRRYPTRGGLESRLLSGGPREPGPGRAWMRAAVPLLPGVPATPLVASAMVADFGSALASFTPLDWSFANIDLALHYTRPPESDWIFVAAKTISAGDGTGLVETILADRRGSFGRAHQTLFIEQVVARPRAVATAEVTA